MTVTLNRISVNAYLRKVAGTGILEGLAIVQRLEHCQLINVLLYVTALVIGKSTMSFQPQMHHSKFEKDEGRKDQVLDSSPKKACKATNLHEIRQLEQNLAPLPCCHTRPWALVKGLHPYSIITSAIRPPEAWLAAQQV